MSVVQYDQYKCEWFVTHDDELWGKWNKKGEIKHSVVIKGIIFDQTASDHKI